MRPTLDLPDGGLEGLIEIVEAAMPVDGTIVDRIDTAYSQTLQALSG